MRQPTGTAALFPLLLAGLLVLLLAVPTALSVLPGGLPSATADEDEDGEDGEDGEGGKKDGPEEGDDLGDQNVPFAEKVNKAIDLGVNWLLAKPDFFSQRKLDFAHWGLTDAPRFYDNRVGKKYQNPAGPTALALYALLKCGVSPKDEIIQKGFNWIRERHKMTERWDRQEAMGLSWRHTQAASSYELSVMLLALTAKYDQYKKTSATKKAVKKKKLRVRDKDDLEWMIEMVEALIERRGVGQPDASREEKLGWRYNKPEVRIGTGGGGAWTRQAGQALSTGNQDLSSTQLATMALFSASRFGLKIPTQVWKDIIEFTLTCQEEEGPEHKRHVPGYIPDRYGKKEWIDHARGFMYIKGSPSHNEGVPSGSMTSCGVANLLIAREMMSKDKKARKKFVDSGQLKKVDTAIYDGLAWLDRNWSSFQNRGKGTYHVYYLYCLERAMDLMGKRLVGRRLWYREGALELLKRQKPVEVNIKRKKDGGPRPGVFWNANASHDPKDVLDTCFALLFLKRATHGMLPPAGPVVTGGK